MSTPTQAPTSIPLSELARRLELEAPAQDMEITGVNTIEAAGPGDLTFLANDRYAAKLKTSRAGAVLVASDYDGDVPMTALRAGNPRLAFAQVLQLFHPRQPGNGSIHPTAIVPESCTLGTDVSIGAYAVLGERCTVADGVVLHPHVVLYDDVAVGAESTIHSHVSVREGTRIGERAVIQNGAMIGTDGFGFEPDERGHLQRVPQIGTVQIGNDVDIQSNACVDRSAMGATTVGDGTKIDNLAQIAHGCTIGKHSVICGQVGLAGSTHVGNHVMLGGQVGSAGHIKIGDGVQVAAKSGIVFDLPPGQNYGGTPAMEIKKALRSALFIGELPTFSRSIKKLERAVAKLEARLDEEATSTD